MLALPLIKLLIKKVNANSLVVQVQLDTVLVEAVDSHVNRILLCARE